MSPLMPAHPPDPHRHSETSPGLEFDATSIAGKPTPPVFSREASGPPARGEPLARPKVGARFRYTLDCGLTVEVDTLLMSLEDWQSSPLNGSPDWSSLPLADGSVMVQRLFG